MKTIIDRRNLLRTSVTALGTLTATKLAFANQACRNTVAQPEGPFYPINDQADKDNDLTYVQGRNQRAIGEVVKLKGIVLDNMCRPIKGALVEIWQACASGKYNHPGDPNTAALDPNFQYWGKAITNDKGEYEFITIKPGTYRANSTWVRPPHIHLKASLRGHEELTTQVYFKRDLELNNKDLILQKLSLADQKDVIVDFQSGTGKFNITLARI